VIFINWKAGFYCADREFPTLFKNPIVLKTMTFPATPRGAIYSLQPEVHPDRASPRGEDRLEGGRGHCHHFEDDDKFPNIPHLRALQDAAVASHAFRFLDQTD
jgi:hypothetical protein